METKRKLRPVLDGDFWLTGGNPDLGKIGGNRDDSKGWVQECVDHHIFRAGDGLWHLWGCIRGTKVGRILYHWKAASLTDRDWEQTGEMIRCNTSYGENLSRWGDQDWIQSPFIMHDGEKYIMFYGGHSTQWDVVGACTGKAYPSIHMQSAMSRGQICSMESADGLHWTRRLNRDGQSRLFIGPGEARDPSLLKVGDVWHLYYAGAVLDESGAPLAGDYLRTSVDLRHWSDWRLVHRDRSVTDPSNLNKPVWTHECPTVVYREGYYYLFRTENYTQRRTHVYRSEDPADFGLTDSAAQEKYVGMIAVGAPEIITDTDGAQYITSSHLPSEGTLICRLKWEEIE